MFTEPKRGNGLRESELCYATKRLWAIVCYYEIYEKITFEYFINNIEHFINKYEFDWPKPKPGKDEYPKYDTAKEWPSKYDYESCVQCFENYQLNYDKKKADSIYDKKYSQDTISDFQNYDAYDQEIKKELQEEHPNFKKIALLEDLKDRAWNRSNKRSGRDIKKFEGKIDGNVNATANVEFTKYTTDQAKNFLKKLDEMKK